MMKKILNLCAVGSILFVTLSASQAKATQCAYGELMVDFVQVQTFAPEDFYTANIIGTIDLPNPNYAYTLKLEPFKAGGMVRGTLQLFEKDAERKNAAVITPTTIESTIKIPFDAAGVFIDVVKTFNWGAEYFTVKFQEGFNGTKSLCMPAEVYK
ncbi:MAG: hypothetical protein COB14_07905 [Alphaproteobacteria bacterium]|nr:MAG: hypothetical protein COB14_07905 [Alphaproteobacteria bacterium]